MEDHSFVMTKCIDANNRAVKLIITGDYDAAIIILGEVLEFSLQVVESVEATESISATAGQIHSALDLSLDQSMKECHDHHTCKNVAHQSIYNIYGRAIPIDVDTDNFPVDREALAFVSIIVIFNLALAYHFASLTTTSRIYYLRKAGALYGLADSIAAEEFYGSKIFFSLACLNNAGLIYQELEDSIKSRRCFELLLSTLMLLVDCGEEKPIELDCYLQNTFSLYASQVSAAAA